jgi:hypothetical protein
MSNPSSPPKTLLFFSPHANIWQHAIPEAQVAYSLKKSGYSIRFMGCRGLLSDRCTTFDALGIRGEIDESIRKKTCQKCIAKQKLTDHKLGIQRWWLDDFIQTDEITAIRKNIQSSEENELPLLEFDHITFGKYATYEVLLNYKLGEIKFQGAALTEYQGHLTGCQLALTAFNNLLKTEKFDAFFCYNSLYSVNHSLMRFLQNHQIQTYTFHSGNNFSQRLKRLVVSNATTIDHEKHLLQLWKNYGQIPCSAGIASFITDHLMIMMGANSMFQYGAKFDPTLDVRKHWGISSDQKLLLATMSSQDERFAAEAVGVGWEKEKELLFKNQIDWVHWLIDYVKDKPEFFLVIRVHPREFPNKREKQLSQQAGLLSELFKILPPNAVVNYPIEGISIYNLMRETDVLLNHHSSSGREFAMIGKPVVIYSKGISSFPTDFCLLGITENQYQQAIEEAIAKPFDFERVRKVYRWLTLDHAYSTIDLSDVITFAEQKNIYSLSNILLKSSELSGIAPLYKSALYFFYPLKLKKARQINRLVEVIENAYASFADVSISITTKEEEETAVLQNELNRMFNYLNIKEINKTQVH